MLKTHKYITIDGESHVNDTKVATFRAVIDSDNSKSVRFTVVRHDDELYKEHRVAVRADEAEFEDYAYNVQSEMLNK